MICIFSILLVYSQMPKITSDLGLDKVVVF